MTSEKLEALIAAFNAAHRRIQERERETLDDAIANGGRIEEMKAAVRHGEWQAFAKKNLDGSPQHIRNYQKLWKGREILEPHLKKNEYLSKDAALTILAKHNAKQKAWQKSSSEDATPKRVPSFGFIFAIERRHREQHGFVHGRENNVTQIYFSGSGRAKKFSGMSTEVLGPATNLMSSYWYLRNEPQTTKDEIANVQRHFLDSGAFTLASEKGFDWDSDDARKYRDAYVAFLKSGEVRVDLYANLDAIGDPETTWNNQRYLEDEHGLTPVPVVHCGTDLKWLEQYLEAGYKRIGLGGLVKYHRAKRKDWLDQCFERICETPNRRPCVHVHGFSVTSERMLLRYPWASVDSTAWAKHAGKGNICLPKRISDGFSYFSFLHSCEVTTVSDQSKGTQQIPPDSSLAKWLELIGVEQGCGSTKEIEAAHKNQEFGKKLVPGVTNDYRERRRANLAYYRMLEAHLPPYPRPFPISRRREMQIPVPIGRRQVAWSM